MHQVEVVVAAAHATASVAAVSVAVAHLDPAPLGQRIVLATIVIGIEELLKPLEELEVVLETSLNQFINWYDLRTSLFAWSCG